MRWLLVALLVAAGCAAVPPVVSRGQSGRTASPGATGRGADPHQQRIAGAQRGAGTGSAGTAKRQQGCGAARPGATGAGSGGRDLLPDCRQPEAGIAGRDHESRSSDAGPCCPPRASAARMGGELPKQYLEVAGATLLEHSLRALLAASSSPALSWPCTRRIAGRRSCQFSRTRECTRLPAPSSAAVRCWRAWMPWHSGRRRRTGCWYTMRRGPVCSVADCSD